ncbi:response regulator [Niastella caeni]|uniref:Response regulator n=1 Tax=Niastella caeni TaxID=2569763 RepID=A0A4S8HXS3_9BACT|nr:response regulator [Niastella caeni]THU40440.1 response regulator [Niastella caeni]
MAQYPDMKIFIVDDDIFCLTLYEQFLRNLGYTEIVSFNCGDECLQEIKEEPALVIMDYNMEGMNGIEVLKKIKAINPGIMVYIISGQENSQVAKEAHKHGALDYVVKSSLSPDKMATIMQRVEQLYQPRQKEVKKSFFQKMKSGLGI